MPSTSANGKKEKVVMGGALVLGTGHETPIKDWLPTPHTKKMSDPDVGGAMNMELGGLSI